MYILVSTNYNIPTEITKQEFDETYCGKLKAGGGPNRTAAGGCGTADNGIPEVDGLLGRPLYGVRSWIGICLATIFAAGITFAPGGGCKLMPRGAAGKK